MELSKSSTNAIKVIPYNEITLEELPYRYPMRNAVTMDAEIKQVKIAVSQGYPSITLGPLKDEWISIVGYGPTLRDTYRQITRPFMTVSGAHDFVCARGVKPDYHAECDGREHKTKHLEKSNAETTYLIATICNPRAWELLEGRKVVTWHNANGRHIVDWIGQNDPGTILVAGGSVVGLSAIHLAGIMGYRKFRLFGFDGNFAGDKRHAGKHYGPPQRMIERVVKGRTWKTTPQMSNSSDELGWLIRDHPELEIEIYGDSMVRGLYGPD
jgi:uncharacterized Rossmann fold enzyme